MLPLFRMNDILTYNHDFWPLFEALPRTAFSNSLVNYGVFASFLIIALAKFYKPSIFHILLKVGVKNNALNQIIRESYGSFRFPDFLLLINFWWTSTMGSVLFYDIAEIPFEIPFIWHLIWPVLLQLFLFIPLGAISFISGNQSIIKENIYNIFLLPQLFGILFLPIIIIGHLNGELMIPMGWVFACLVSFLFFYINLRGFLFAIQQGISLYYIILYICTLEILPLTVLFYAFVAIR